VSDDRRPPMGPVDWVLAAAVLLLFAVSLAMSVVVFVRQ
jgi:hypothetical protein